MNIWCGLALAALLRLVHHILALLRFYVNEGLMAGATNYRVLRVANRERLLHVGKKLKNTGSGARGRPAAPVKRGAAALVAALPLCLPQSWSGSDVLVT
jgi:hypothetical protein